MMTEKEFLDSLFPSTDMRRAIYSPHTVYEAYRQGFLNGQNAIARAKADSPAKSLAKARESHKSQLNPKRKK